MHELSIAAEIYRVCRREVEARGAGRLEEVRVAVGELSAVEPDLLAFAWEAVVAGGPDCEARLEIEWHPARQRCPDCGDVAERQAGSWMRLCPDCGAPLCLEGGKDLDILTIAFDVEEFAREVHPG
jgi:hydrogenase nickel incorporation protein HypA/HybF